jgi:hypothetical protein
MLASPRSYTNIRATKAPPDERGGNRYVRPTATASHSDSLPKPPVRRSAAMSLLSEENPTLGCRGLLARTRPAAASLGVILVPYNRGAIWSQHGFARTLPRFKSRPPEMPQARRRIAPRRARRTTERGSHCRAPQTWRLGSRRQDAGPARTERGRRGCNERRSWAP